MARSTEKQPAVETEAAEEKPLNGVLVARVVGEDGSIFTDIQPVGDVQLTEIQTILELGLKAFREKIGLNGKH